MLGGGSKTAWWSKWGDLPPSKGALRFINWGLSVCRVNFGNSFKIETWFASGGGELKDPGRENGGHAHPPG